jgi:hypothetical protein
MQKLITIFLLVFFTKTNFQKFNNTVLTDTTKRIEVVNNQVLYESKMIGTIKSEKISTNGGKNLKFQVKVYETDGKEIAKFEIEVTAKAKKNTDPVKHAVLTTSKDNVVHNGSNFIDYHLPCKELEMKQNEVPQICKMVNYLIDNKYLEIKR